MASRSTRMRRTIPTGKTSFVKGLPRSNQRKSKRGRFIHFALGPLGRVILSNAKNLSERPFAALRVTLPLCQSLAA